MAADTFMTALRQQARQAAGIFRPPFQGLWLVALLYYAWAFFVYPHSPILRGDLPDTDDYMYLNQVLDWLHGQGWYDNIQHRLDPPVDGSLGGAPIHFSRLVQLPMAGLIWLLERTGLGPQSAATIMAVFYPLGILALFFQAMRWLAASFMPRDWTGVTAYIVLFTAPSLFLFAPGHIDHHDVILIVLAASLGCLLRMTEQRGRWRWGFSAGLLLAFGLTVALEILPWLLLTATWLGLWAVAHSHRGDRRPALQALLFGVTLHLASAVFLLLTRPPAAFFTEDVLTYSVVYVYLTGGIAVAFAGLALVAGLPTLWRWGVAGTLAAVLGALFLHRFPDLVSGPYGGMDPTLAQIILGEISEAQPLKLPTNSWLSATWCLGVVAVAFPAGVYFYRRADRAGRWRWALLLLLLAGATGLACFYQRRFIGTMGMLTVVPRAALLWRGWQGIAVRYTGRIKTWAEIGLLLLVGPLPSLLYPALLDGRSFNTGLLLFPVHADTETSQCDMFQLEHILRDPARYGDRPRLIMSTIGAGPELLFRTQHSVLSAPYHMDVAGNIDATRFFSTPYPEEAEAIARRRHVDLVVSCRYIPEVYLRRHSTTRLKPGEEFADFAPHFIGLLMAGRAPDWLKPVELPGLKNYVVYEVVPDGAAVPMLPALHPVAAKPAPAMSPAPGSLR